GVAAEADEHLLRRGLRGEELCACQRSAKRRQIQLAQELFLVVGEHAHDALAGGGLGPAPAEKFNLSEFRHGRWGGSSTCPRSVWDIRRAGWKPALLLARVSRSEE